MKELLYYIPLFIIISFIIYLIFRSFHYNPMLIEGMTDNSNKKDGSKNGITDNAATYAASLKASTIKTQDELLITKFKSDYETAILNLDDLINVLMLKTSLTFNEANSMDSIDKLSKMQQAKAALNSVMKFVDSQ
jgi:hypothetical protein